MFSDQYKKDNEKIMLDDEFLEQLKVRMRQERTRLQEEASVTEPTSKEEILINIKEKPSNRLWKHTLPVALAACAVLALVVTVPQQFVKYEKSANDTSNSGINSSVSNSTTATVEESVSSDMATQDTAGSAEKFGTEFAPSEEADGMEQKSAAADESQSINNEVETIESGTADNTKMTTTTMDSEDASVYLGFDNLSFDQAELDLTNVNEFQPTDSEVLTNLASVYMNKEKGADAVSLDYADNERLILHDYYGMIIYDIQEERIIRIVDLKSRIGEYTTQGDTTLNVTVFEGGNYLLLDNHTVKSEDSLYYLYDVQTDTMVSMTKKQLDTLTLPAKDTSLTYETNSFDSLFQPGNRSLAASQINSTEQCILFYQSTESSSIASLSICIATFDEKGNQTGVSYLPIFGDDAISQVEESGYELDGILE